MTSKSRITKVRHFFANTEERNYNDKAYKAFRAAVVKRDCGCCQWPGCGSGKCLRVHHIRTWAAHHSLRYVVSNGIVLCNTHHNSIWGKEEDYERIFSSIVGRNTKDPKHATRDRKTPRRRSKKKNATSFAAKYVRAKRKARWRYR